MRELSILLLDGFEQRIECIRDQDVVLGDQTRCRPTIRCEPRLNERLRIVDRDLFTVNCGRLKREPVLLLRRCNVFTIFCHNSAEFTYFLEETCGDIEIASTYGPCTNELEDLNLEIAL